MPGEFPANAAILRLLDANANRAREALRVLEDYTRLIREDRELAAALKSIRHDLAGLLQNSMDDAIVHRDTAGDVGRENKTDAESRRADLAHVVVANAKRLGEALRSIEEYLKVIDPAHSGDVERLRYRFYDIERDIHASLHPATRFAGVRLCVLITESLCRVPWLEAAEQALRGGADCLQLREKTLESGALLERARALVELCRRHQALCIINDRPDIAALARADGVHLGQTDVPAARVRALLGNDAIIGISTHTIEQARTAAADGADYIGAGPFFRSSTKPRDFVAGAEFARQVAAQIAIPALAIGGITSANLGQVLNSGMTRIAVTSAVLAADNVREAAAALKMRLVQREGQSPR